MREWKEGEHVWQRERQGVMARIHVRSKLVEGAELVKKKKEEHHLDRAPFQLMYLLAMGGGYRCVPHPTNPTKHHQAKPTTW